MKCGGTEAVDAFVTMRDIIYIQSLNGLVSFKQMVEKLNARKAEKRVA